MKCKPIILCASLAAAMAFGPASNSAQASSYPSVPLSISGTLVYSTASGRDMGVPLKQLSYSSQSLIGLLNASSYATNVIFQVTGKKQIPAGSYFLWNPDDENLIITNKNGFSFPLQGSYNTVSADPSYDFGYLEIDESGLVGTYDLNGATLAGSETDKTGIYFYFYDGSENENEIELYGTATLTWNYGPAKGGYQKATLIVSMSGNGSDGCYVDDFDAVPTSFSATGTGSISEPTDDVPFYYEW